jgi:hypothetical protein
VNPILAVIALAVVAGAVVALSTPDPRGGQSVPAHRGDVSER